MALFPCPELYNGRDFLKIQRVSSRCFICDTFHNAYAYDNELLISWTEIHFFLHNMIYIEAFRQVCGLTLVNLHMTICLSQKHFFYVDALSLWKITTTLTFTSDETSALLVFMNKLKSTYPIHNIDNYIRM